MGCGASVDNRSELSKLLDEISGGDGKGLRARGIGRKEADTMLQGMESDFFSPMYQLGVEVKGSFDTQVELHLLPLAEEATCSIDKFEQLLFLEVSSNVATVQNLFDVCNCWFHGEKSAIGRLQYQRLHQLSLPPEEATQPDDLSAVLTMQSSSENARLQSCPQLRSDARFKAWKRKMDAGEDIEEEPELSQEACARVADLACVIRLLLKNNKETEGILRSIAKKLAPDYCSQLKGVDVALYDYGQFARRSGATPELGLTEQNGMMVMNHKSSSLASRLGKSYEDFVCGMKDKGVLESFSDLNIDAAVYYYCVLPQDLYKTGTYTAMTPNIRNRGIARLLNDFQGPKPLLVHHIQRMGRQLKADHLGVKQILNMLDEMAPNAVVANADPTQVVGNAGPTRVEGIGDPAQVKGNDVPTCPLDATFEADAASQVSVNDLMDFQNHITKWNSEQRAWLTCIDKNLSSEAA